MSETKAPTRPAEQTPQIADLGQQFLDAIDEARMRGYNAGNVHWAEDRERFLQSAIGKLRRAIELGEALIAANDAKDAA